MPQKNDKALREGLTFDDVMLVPSESNILPSDVDVSTHLTRSISLNIPILSAAMDTVTESKTAICLAQEGGIGIIHRNMGIAEQAQEVEKVKKSESGMIVDPITIAPEQKIKDTLELMSKYRISGIPVTKGKKLVGIITNRDLRFETNLEEKVQNVMTKENLVTVKEGINLEESKKILHKHKIEKLLVVDKEYNLRGLITIKDIEKMRKYPHSCKDHLGRLRVGAAVGVSSDREQRVDALLKAGCDVIVVDTAHGHSKNVIETIRVLKGTFKDIQIIAGNVATKEGCVALIKAGCDAVKIGVGPGSICTTRIIAGIGVPQISAIKEAAKAAARHDIPIIADGGIKFSGDVTKAIAAGAHTVMIGNLFAGTDETPGEMVLYQGRTYKVYRGMGSLEAMKEGKSRDRYSIPEDEIEAKIVPEGIEGRVPYRGSLSICIHQLIGGLKAGMGYVGSRTLKELQTKCRFIRISAAGLRESHVHDVIITKEAPNYRIE
ncbi:MAG TPA: IMP dehydrogenase [Syntrophorhabdaceae bacterium]|jgi:IMP dehydrogenase|nr:IMP dehydrogenase [Syntrophorhabdaceae bacterium]HNT69516.1 IMP dehydrogenase [Syntrophorhabdaceae bacterium]